MLLNRRLLEAASVKPEVLAGENTRDVVTHVPDRTDCRHVLRARSCGRPLAWIRGVTLALLGALALTVGVTSAPAAAAAPRTPGLIDIQGNPTCASDVVHSVRLEGYGRRVTLLVTPRLWARRAGVHRDSRQAWSKLMTCLAPHLRQAPLTPWQVQSMYKQFYCHDYFPISSRTWDLESWRSNVPWGAVLRRTGDSAYAYCNYDSGGTVLSLDAYNYPRMRVSAVRDGQAALVPASIARGARFRVVVGLAGAGNSLQEINALGQGTDYYLRHRNGQVMLQKAIKVGREHANRVDPLFAADASFHVRTRQGAPSLRAFQSYNYTDHFIRHFRGRLEIGTPRTRPGTPFAADRYFIIRR